ncbi:MAG TPA: hypothetical protein VE988_12345, partial [Gemmataceae bacterium]|nr:hypothetical protein [Gemmataceae bacterium]
MRSGLIGLILCLMATPAHSGQSNSDAPAPKNTVPGLQLAPVPAILNAQVPKLPRGQGLVIEQIGMDLPKSLATLNVHDVLLSYDGKPINDIGQFNRLVQAAKPDQKAPLV